MLDHLAIQYALRTRLLTMAVCTTGTMSLSATTTGYARASGSFLTDGFALGMEITPAGFAANPVDTLIGVTALTLTTRTARAAEGAAGGRTIAVGAPASRAWENVGPFVPVTGVPFLDEQFVRGPGTMDTLGPLARLTGEPLYLPRISVPVNTGIDAASRYANAILNVFPPGLKLVLASGDTVNVRGDAMPFAGQVLQGDPGFAGLLCTIPLRCFTFNSQ